MPLKAIDVAIGMAFLYLLLTLIASTLVELVATVQNWRGRMLVSGIRRLLDGTVVDPEEFYQSPFIRTLAQKPAFLSQPALNADEKAPPKPPRSFRQKPNLPSYVPAGAFSNAMVSLLWQECVRGNDKLHLASPDETARAIGAALVGRPGGRDDPTAEGVRRAEGPSVHNDDALRVVVETALATQGPSIQGIRLALEKWYNDSMDRLTGNYKRLTQVWLLGIGVLGALAVNIDSVAVMKWLWAGDAARQAVVTSATQFSQTHRTEGEAAKGVDQAKDPKALTKAIGQQLSAMAEDVAGANDALTRLQFPLGWHSVDFTGWWFLQYLIGCLMSGLAISVGSSFWFDALQTLVKIRGTGPKPASR